MCSSPSVSRASLPFLCVLTLASAACARAPEESAATAAKLAPGTLGPLRGLEVPSSSSSEPHLKAGSDGTLLLSWVEEVGDRFDHELKFARWTGDGWSAPGVAASGAAWYVNAADVPAVEPVRGDLWAAHWRVTAANDYAFDVMTSVSADGGKTWSAPRVLNDDGTASEHGFVSLFPWNDGVGAVWLDGRDTVNEEGVDAAGNPLGTSLRLARLGSDGTIGEQGVVDALVCDCCTTGIAATAAGLAVVYRDRSPEEIRDIVVRRERDGVWSEPVQAGADHWRIEGCPVNGPAIAARGDNVAVAWFTAPDNRSRVRFAASTDGAESFAAAVDVDTEAPIGHVGVALVSERMAFVTWWRPDPAGGAQLAVRSVDFAGMLGPIVVVARSSSSRPDDVPQIAQVGNRLLFAWTDSGDVQTVRTAVADIGGL